jgi:hypothetical protein
MMPTRAYLFTLFTLAIAAWVVLPGSITTPVHGPTALAELRTSA